MRSISTGISAARTRCFRPRSAALTCASCRRLWEPVWRFCLAQPDDIRFYLRYYYSAQFLASAHELHHRNYQQLQARLSRYFISSHDSWLLMAHIFETILSFVSHVLCGDLQDTPELDEQVFSLIFRTLQPYMLP